MRKLQWVVSFLLLLAVGSSVVRAFESPIDESAVVKTGNLTLLEPKEIIVEEKLLHLTLDGDYTHVYAYYKMLNPGPEDRINLGIPVVYLKESEFYGLAWQEESFFAYQISDEQGMLDVQEYMDEKPEIVILDGKKRDVIRKWYVTEVNFPANGRKEFVVSYTVRNSFLDKDSVSSFFPYYSDRLFNYSFIPSGGWGNDLIKNFKIVVDARENLKNGAVIKSLGFEDFYGFGGLYIFETQNFNLQTLPELKILYDNSAALYTELINAYQVRKENIVGLQSSSALPGHAPANLLDSDLRTAWISGQTGVNEPVWIEISLQDFCLQAVGIINGLPVSQDTYYAYSRIKRLKIEIELDEYDYFMDKTKKVLFEKEVELEDKPSRSFNPVAFAPFVSVLADLGQSFNQAYRVRLTVLEVYPGTNQQTCISELFLLGYKNDQDFANHDQFFDYEIAAYPDEFFEDAGEIFADPDELFDYHE